jgi:hypothetical protein
MTPALQEVEKTGWVVRRTCVVELSAAGARPRVDERGAGAGASAESSIVNNQSESLDGTAERVVVVGLAVLG